MAVNDVIECTIFTTQGNQLGVMRRHWLVIGETGAGAGISEMAAAEAARIPGPVKALLHQSASYRGLSMQRVFPVPPSLRSYSTLFQGPGVGAAGDLMPRQVAGIVTLVTLLAGVKYRGRMYAPFPGETDSDVNGRPNGVYQGFLGTLGGLFVGDNTIVGALGTSTLRPVIWHRLDAVQPSTTPVFAAVPRATWGTQRRRGDYGSPNVSPI